MRTASRILVAHPSPDLYGSDWQLVETIHGLIEAGQEVVVALPLDGPLVEVLRDAGARVAVMPFTVLRKALLSPTGLARLSAQAAPEIARLRAVIRASRAEAVLTNTVTIPWWPVAASAAGVPVLAHVHEAEDTQRRIIRAGLNAPLLAASRIVANSGAARDALLDVQPRLAPRTEVVHNGVAGPDQPLEPLRHRRPTWPVLEAADAVVVPSRAEPFGNTAVEAMHAARPLVASRVQGLAEVVTDAVTGLLVPADDAAALAEALGALATDPDLAGRLAEQGRREAAERFSVSGYRATMARIVGEILER